MKRYEDLSVELQREAREMNPEDYKDYVYMVKGVEIEFCAQ